MIDTIVQVHVQGPLFDRRADKATQDYLRQATYMVAGQALADVHLILDRSIRHPTPYYETQVMLQRVGQDMVVHDRGIVYGPWLEGVSHRNMATRFKGYHAFRRATQGMSRKAQQIAERELRPYLARMNA